MSGFVLSAGPAARDARWGEALRFVPEATAVAIDWKGWSGHLLYFGAARLWAPAVSRDGRLRIALVGHIALDAEQWQQAQALPGEGGLACRWLLEQWQRGPEAFALALNGPAIALVWGQDAETLRLITDRMGVCPAYRSTRGALRLASHADVLADLLVAEGQPVALDRATLAECLYRGYGVQPFTYHEGIEQLEPATHYRLERSSDAATLKATVYWRPESVDTKSSVEALAEGFAQALRNASQSRGHAESGRQALLLSGGADSRALLFAAADPRQIDTLTFCDEANPEARVAERLAQLAGAQHRRLLRSPEHYAEGARETVRITGGMWSLKDAHFQGFLPLLREMKLGGLLTGCYTDYLYKGLAYNRAPRRFLGRALPSEDFAAYADEFYQPEVPIADAWTAAARARLASCIPPALRQRYAEAPQAVEDLRVRPLSREADAMGRLFLLRTLPWDPVMIDNALLAYYQRIPPTLKLNARLFRLAVLRVLPVAARAVPNNNDGLSLAAPEWARDARYIAAMSARKLAKLLGLGAAPRLATAGSWPNFRYFIATSRVLPELWSQPGAGTRELLTELLGRDPWSRSLPEWAASGSDLFLRLVTLKLWLDSRRT